MTKNWNYNKKVGLEKDNSLGNTNTPPEVATQVVEKLVDLSLVTKDSKFLEPCVGVGSFFFAIVDHLSKKFDIDHVLDNMVYAYEIDDAALKIFKKDAKIKYKKIPKNVFKGNFLTVKINQKFDYIITNPPYIAASKMAHTGYATREDMIEDFRTLIDTDISKKADMYIYFFVKTLQLLNDEGKQILLCSDSWLDSNFGDIIKKYLSKDYNLDLLISNRLHSLFRDDTSSILTVVSKTEKGGTKIYQNDKGDLSIDLKKPSLSLKKEELVSYLADESVNKRNLLVLFGKEYIEGQKFRDENEKILTKLKDLISIESSTITFNDLKKQKLLNENKVETKIFFQIQARVNKPPNYKNSIRESELLYSLNSNNIDLPLRKNNAYFSTIIDRYPLVFYVKNKETYHVSKYLSLQFHDKKNTVDLLPVLINNLVTLYMIEVFIKEGTRKTLRVGEMGYGKEIRKSEIENLDVLNVDKLSKKAIDKIKDHQKNLENVVLYNIEEALKNIDYVSIQKIILEDLKINISFEDLKEKVLDLYYRRMRNVEKIEQRSK